jgi:MFS-type transporter involved in bile tolerance (Atg22 family)
MPAKPTSDADRRYAMLGFRIIAEFGAVIAVPAVIASVIGRRLDAAYGTRPTLLIASFTAAAIGTALMLIRRARAFAKEYEAIIASHANEIAARKDHIKEE